MRIQDIESLELAVKMAMKEPGKRFTISELASSAAMSETKFKKKFREHYGLPVSSYITKLKLNKAKELLQETDFSINYIAKKTGYHHPGNFCKAYKKHFNLKPSDYRSESTKI